MCQTLFWFERARLEHVCVRRRRATTNVSTCCLPYLFSRATRRLFCVLMRVKITAINYCFSRTCSNSSVRHRRRLCCSSAVVRFLTFSIQSVSQSVNQSDSRPTGKNKEQASNQPVAPFPTSAPCAHHSTQRNQLNC